MEAPIPFITLQKSKDQNGTGTAGTATHQFDINPAVIPILQKIEGPVGVVAIAGLYRTGKSYILNHLAGSTKGFNIGSTVEPCTQGIWIWIVRASQISNKDFPSNMTLILLDTEGLGSYSKTKTYDIQIFSLTVLLSSFFIYNSIGNIDETAIDRLSLVVELTKHIRIQADSSNQSAEDLHSFFPKFLWLLRDFSLKLVFNGKDISAKEYLENSLALIPGDSEKVKDKNAIRSSIRQFFTNRSCFVMRRPVNDEKLLQKMETVAELDLRPQFVEELHNFISLTYKQVPHKRMYRQVLNGSMFLELAKNYVDAINKGSVPTIRTAWENVIEIENQKAIDMAMASYKKSMSKITSDVFELVTYEKTHLSSLAGARTAFYQHIKGDNIGLFDEKLMAALGEYQLQILQENDEKSKRLCETLMVEVIRSIWNSVENKEIGNLDALRTAWENAIEKQYLPKAKGPQREKILVHFIRQDQLTHSRLISSKMLQATEKEFEKKLEKLKADSKAEYGRLEKLYNDLKSAWERTKLDLQESQDENKQLISTIAKFSTLLNDND